MRSDTTVDPEQPRSSGASSLRRYPALVLLHSREEPHRTGEVWMGPRREPRILGRGAARPEDPHPRGEWIRQRPGRNRPQPPLSASALSRRQLVVAPHPGGMKVVNVGRRAMRVDGIAREEAVVTPGQVLAFDEELVLLVRSRPLVIPALRAWPDELEVPFGKADPFGMVGESEAAWALRDRLAFAAARPLHV